MTHEVGSSTSSGHRIPPGRWFTGHLAFLIFACLPGTILSAQNTAQTEIVFPLYVEIRAIVSGSAYIVRTDIIRMEYEVINPNASGAHIEVHTFDATGKEVVPSSGAPLSLAVTGKGIGRIRSFVGGPVSGRYEIGWVKVVSTEPVIVRQEFVHSTREDCLLCQPPSGEDIKSRFAKFPPRAARHGIIKVRSDFVNCLSGCGESRITYTINTIIAVAFSSSNPAASVKGTFVLRNEKGEFIDQREVSIPANGALVSSYDALFAKPTNPSIPPPLPHITGTLEFVFDGDVYVAAFQLTNGTSQSKGTIEIVEEPNGGIAP